MAANTVPITPGTPKGFGASVTTAQTDKTGATASNIVSAYTAVTAASGGQGALIQDITLNGTATMSAGTVVIFKNVGSTRYFLKEVLVTAVTSSATAVAWTSGKLELNEWLSPGDKLDFMTTITQTIHMAGNAAEY